MRQASLKITTLDRLKNALEQVELRVKGMEARLLPPLQPVFFRRHGSQGSADLHCRRGG